MVEREEREIRRWKMVSKVRVVRHKADVQYRRGTAQLYFLQKKKDGSKYFYKSFLEP